MMEMKRLMLLVATIGVLVSGANAAEILVGDPASGTQEADLITTSEVWTADNTYNLQDQIYVMPGASLTIEAGTVVASDPTGNGSGALAVTRGAKIFINGTATNPVIMTSKNDDFKNWRPAANEWGNLTIMGNALVSASDETGNGCPDGTTEATMEGLIADPADPNRILYGGDDDNDDSGSISHLSLRYGGRVVGVADELNGLSLGGIGRGTDIEYVEVMNNVDDGIEIWGGTVNLKYVSIWNIGDDSFDIDQGWRGKAQFGLIVQGYSLDASQGSGVGDNCFETDGAEYQDAQPRTTSTIYNFTAIGQPAIGDGGTAWRDNARMRYRNCIWMDLGEKLVRFDDFDGDGSDGYSGDQSKSRTTSEDGTLSWVDHWQTTLADWMAGSNSQVNLCDADLNTLYGHMDASSNLCEIKDSVFFRNLHPDAYTEADDLGVLDAATNNVVADEGDMPIKAITRASKVTTTAGDVYPVAFLDPRAANDAATSVDTADANDGFFVPASYRGGFSPDDNWLEGWTAAYQYGMTGMKGDIDGDGNVDFEDFAVLSGDWLQGE